AQHQRRQNDTPAGWQHRRGVETRRRGLIQRRAACRGARVSAPTTWPGRMPCRSEGTAPMTITHPRSLTAIALGLSSVTVVSVGLAMFALIEDRQLAALFAIAAVLLDVFKYLAW